MRHSGRVGEASRRAGSAGVQVALHLSADVAPSLARRAPRLPSAPPAGDGRAWLSLSQDVESFQALRARAGPAKPEGRRDPVPAGSEAAAPRPPVSPGVRGAPRGGQSPVAGGGGRRCRTPEGAGGSRACRGLPPGPVDSAEGNRCPERAAGGTARSPDPQAAPAEASPSASERLHGMPALPVYGPFGALLADVARSLARRAPRLPPTFGWRRARAAVVVPAAWPWGLRFFSFSSYLSFLIDEAFRVASERAPGGPALPCSP